jgi:hypothetical protein
MVAQQFSCINISHFSSFPSTPSHLAGTDIDLFRTYSKMGMSGERREP